MRSEKNTTSAALFCEPKHRVPSEWLERATALFAEYDLAPILFTAGGGGFELDDCYVLAESGNDLILWEELLPARCGGLLDALRKDEIYDLVLDSPRAGAPCRSDWRANVSAGNVGELYLGIDEELISEPATLLRRAFEIAKGLFDAGYGIAYTMPLAEEPDCYASGSRRSSLADFRQMLDERRKGIRRQPTVDELWHQELIGERRHLKGLFRGAYPASILSESHVRGADLSSQAVGRLSELDKSVWLWELSESEITASTSDAGGEKATGQSSTAVVSRLHAD
jgi:hypothetical protein